eukprot:GEMP01127536.1.p1 GENE.GEMP01127536.1~~GEMP01127536.1.p1  ORF type:complete len:110 (-),score=2.94 GEMP01127536.1:179-508(-)
MGKWDHKKGLLKNRDTGGFSDATILAFAKYFPKITRGGNMCDFLSWMEYWGIFGCDNSRSRKIFPLNHEGVGNMWDFCYRILTHIHKNKCNQEKNNSEDPKRVSRHTPR